MAWRRRSRTSRVGKFGNQFTSYNGVKYDSKKEALYAMELNLRLKARDIQKWERQYLIEIKATPSDKKLICRHYVDFCITHNDGSFELVEVKGYETETWKLKRKMLERLWLPYHPEYKYTVVK